ncbi:MAG: DUF3533 domain-containing protein, partial [Mycobacterium sp.]|nr:DUF3533 domain-containing protein [Mycobacterium sp.]
MTESQARHSAPDTTSADDEAPDSPSHEGLGGARRAGPANSTATRTVWFWTVPIVVTLAVLSALAVVYLGGTLKPMDNLRHFPIAVVSEDAGPDGAQVVKRMQAEFDKHAYDLRVLSRDDAKRQLDTAQIYGVAVIPPNFSSKLKSYAKSALGAGRVDRPIIIVTTNQRAGSLGASIAGQALGRGVTIVDELVGKRLSEELAQQAHGAPIPGAVRLMLANPIEVRSVIHNPLPDGTANGLSAFYYALLLLLGGFIG